MCRSRPTQLVAELSQVVTLADGGRVLVRPLLYSDRSDLIEGYGRLTPHSRHLRFFSPPETLSEGDVEYLTNLDYRNHFALAAFAIDQPGAPGIAVARYIREPETTTAEVAVTVLDAYQHRGLGSLLMQRLAEVAASNGVRSFVNFVMWDNEELIELLREEGATVTPDEPGIARVELALPWDGRSVPDWSLHRILHAFADHIRQILEGEGSAAVPVSR